MALNNTQYKTIMHAYDELRDYNRNLLTKRQNEINEAIPEYANLDEKVSTISMEAARQMLSGDEQALSRLHKEISDISDQKRKLLIAHGYSAEYLDPIYQCKDCKDTGYLDTEDGSRRKCHCFRNQEIALLYEQSNIHNLISQENFSTLSYQYYQVEDLERFEKAVNLSKNFVQKYEQDYHNLFFYGTVGTGKSFLSGCIARELLQAGHTVIYFSAMNLFETMARYAFDEKSKETLYNFYDDLYNCDLVIIDDLGTELTNTFVTSQLFACLNERHLRKKATIISTNLSLEELHNRYSDRIFSRIVNQYDLCKLSGPDIRMLRKRTVARTES